MVFPQLAAYTALALLLFRSVLAVIMLGAIRKIFVWKKGFWGQGGGDGWWYELLYITGLLVIVTTGGGEWVLI